MTYIITGACIGTKNSACVDVCPVECIHETDQMLLIDSEECIDCGACEPECPVDAIFPEESLPPALEPFIEINAAWAEGDARVSRLLAERGYVES